MPKNTNRKRNFRKLFTLCSASVLAISVALSAVQAEEDHSFNISAQSLSKALLAFSRQSDTLIVVPPELLTGKTSPRLLGTMEPSEALEILLEGTGLVFRWGEDGGVIITREKIGFVSKSPVRVADNGNDAPDTGNNDDEDDDTSTNEFGDDKDTEIVIVTGTSIRGVAPDSSPVHVYTDLDIAKTGAATFEQFITTLTQNVNTFTSTATLATSSNGNGRNGIDLRGLGAGTTLVLLNGRRLGAPGGVSPDISLIPLAAIERVEVLTDGASAVYGSDAIGGVVNIILKDDVEGFDTSLSYGTVTNGDHGQVKFDVTGGTGWDTGHLTASYTFFDQTPLRAQDRDFAQASVPNTLFPDDVRHSAFVAFEQNLGDKFTFNTDLLYSTRKTQTKSVRGLADIAFTGDLEQDQFFASGGLTYKIDSNFTFDVFASYSNFKEGLHQVQIRNSDGSIASDNQIDTDADELELGAKIDGALLNLPAGELRFSLGAGYGEETYDVRFSSGGAPVSIERDRKYVFGEVFVPIIGPEQGIFGINRLEVTGALRFEDYSDFGSRVIPRAGVLWSPIDGVNFRGTYSEAFRAPSLRQLGGSILYFIIPPTLFGFPDPFSNDNSSIYLFAQGAGTSIGPETSTSFTAGFDIDRTGIEGLSLSGTYFNIDYVDRVAIPDSTGGFAALADPSLFPTIFNTNPSLEIIEGIINTGQLLLDTTGTDTTDAAAVLAVITVVADNRLQNIASSKVSGFDFGFDYSHEGFGGNVSLGSHMTFMFTSTIIVAPGTPVISELNRPTQPVDFKLRSYAGFTKGGFIGQVVLNYVDSYSDPFQTPEAPVGSWVTVDLNFSYDLGSAGNPQFFKNTVVSLNVQNLFNQDPPFLGVAGTTNIALNEPVGFDPTNASPLGRFIRLTLRKKW